MGEHEVSHLDEVYKILDSRQSWSSVMPSQRDLAQLHATLLVAERLEEMISLLKGKVRTTDVEYDPTYGTFTLKDVPLPTEEEISVARQALREAEVVDSDAIRDPWQEDEVSQEDIDDVFDRALGEATPPKKRGRKKA